MNFDLQFNNLSMGFSVYASYAVFTSNYLKHHHALAMNYTFKQEKLKSQSTFNPGLVVIKFQTIHAAKCCQSQSCKNLLMISGHLYLKVKI